MDFFELIKKRRSTRSYVDKKIDDSQLEKILQACSSAPSAGNLQAYRIFVVRNLETKQKLVKAAMDQEFIAQAAVALVFFAIPEESSKKYGDRGASLYCVQDATIAAAYAQLAAVDLGLETAWVGAFYDKEAAEACGVTDKNLIPVAIIPIGHGNPNYEKRPFKRKNPNELVDFI